MSLWEEKFKTQCQIRRAVILHGNVYDIYWDNLPTGISFVRHIVNLSKSKLGYEHIVCWDVNTGTRTFGEGTEKELRNDLKNSMASPEAEADQDGSDYDLGDGIAAQTDKFDMSMKKPQDFFAFLLKRFSTENNKATPAVYIVDGADALFGNSSSLSEAERNLILEIGQTLRDAPCTLDPRKLQQKSDLLILITSRLSLIPSRFYQDNPAVTDVHIGLPSRTERADFIASHSTALMVKESMTKGSGDFEDLVDSLDHFTYRDIQQLCHLSIAASRKGEEPIPCKKLVNLYKYGEKRSPWEELSRDKLKGLEEYLKGRVKGQDHVVERVATVIRKAFVGLSGLQHSGRQQMPKGTFFFVGPTGVGKTEMAKSIAQFLFGDEEACIRFDMSEYSSENSDQRLVGAPPGYVGYEEGGQLTNAVKQHPFSVLLFDEIEKAHCRIFDKFLQILEDGRLTDGKGDTVNFSDSIIIFTSNIGASSVDPGSPNPRDEFFQAVRKHFVVDMNRPELFNRIGVSNIIPFNFLTDTDVLMKIVVAKLKPLREKLKEKYDIKLEIVDQDKALKILENGFDCRNGGRGIAYRLNEEIIEPLSDYLFNADEDELHGSTIIAKLDKTGKHFWFHLAE